MGIEINLFESHREDLAIYLSAYIHPENEDLVIAGQDIGSFVEKMFGDSDYEYWLSIPASEKSNLLIHLQEDGFGLKKIEGIETDDDLLLAAIGEKYGGNGDVFKQIGEYCKEIGIQTEFHCY